MRCIQRPMLLLLLSAVACDAQAYDYYNEDRGGDYGGDYGGDNLYANYAARQHDKMDRPATGGIGWGKLVVGCAASWFLGGRYHSRKAVKKMRTKFQKEQKELYQQYYNDVHALTESNKELTKLIEELSSQLSKVKEEHEMEAIQRDYDEFKQPDLDGDDRISRAEFSMYVKDYLSHYPGLSEADYPKFEDFDHDHDGYVSFMEYSEQMALQAQKAEIEQLYGGSEEKASAYNSMARNKLYR